MLRNILLNVSASHLLPQFTITAKCRSILQQEQYSIHRRSAEETPPWKTCFAVERPALPPALAPHEGRGYISTGTVPPRCRSVSSACKQSSTPLHKAAHSWRCVCLDTYVPFFKYEMRTHIRTVQQAAALHSVVV